MTMTFNPSLDRKLYALTRLVDIGFGSLWWGRDDLIEEKQPGFHRNPDRTGHPLLSVLRVNPRSRFAGVPMLFGTSAANSSQSSRERSVLVTGLTKKDPDRVTCFGVLVAPGLYGVEDLVDAFLAKKGNFRSWRMKDGVRPPHEHIEPAAWHENHRISPNKEKTRLSPEEERQLESYCERHHL